MFTSIAYRSLKLLTPCKISFTTISTPSKLFKIFLQVGSALVKVWKQGIFAHKYGLEFISFTIIQILMNENGEKNCYMFDFCSTILVLSNHWNFARQFLFHLIIDQNLSRIWYRSYLFVRGVNSVNLLVQSSNKLHSFRSEKGSNLAIFKYKSMFKVSSIDL